MTLALSSLELPLERSRILFLLLLLLCGSGLFSPGLALLIGCVFAFTQVHPLQRESASAAKFLLQASVVALGFGMDAREVLHAGRSGLGYTAVGIVLTMGLGLMLGRALCVRGRTSFLIAAGTAICGGSAIAALAPVLVAETEEISVAMGTVFTLNAVALFLFPAIGLALHLTQSQFGLWAALAIHDTSSVVGAAAHFGPVALGIATAVKLARALWIVPVSVATAIYMRRGGHGGAGRIQVPWFILLFCLAALCNTLLPSLHGAFHTVTALGHNGLAATLFLIGTGLSLQALRQVGPRPMVQGVVLWVAVLSASLYAIVHGYLSL